MELGLTAVELGKKIKAGEISVVEATTAYLDAMEAREKDIHAFVTIDREGALKRAEEVQKGIEDGTYTGPLAGVPVAIKDNMCIDGMLTTCSSKILSTPKYALRPFLKSLLITKFSVLRCVSPTSLPIS